MKNYKQIKGDLGQHWTPEKIVEKMISLIKNNGLVLEPSAGSGRFVKRIRNCVAIEIDSNVVPEKYKKQYIIMNFFDYPTTNKFDTIIGNPPYVAGRLLTSDWFSSWVGEIPRTANAYLHFIEKSLEHLKNHGELIFIVPLSFLSDTSRGRNLRKKMLKDGAFTHIFNHTKTEWESAMISTLIFRWQKNISLKKVITDNKKLNLFEKDGFIWLLNFKPNKVLGDYFKVTVGSAPLKIDILNSKNSKLYGEYIRNGKLIKVCEKNINVWPRVHNTLRTNKIFFVPGPTRKWPIFTAGNSPKHLDYVLLPKSEINTIKTTIILNDWFKKNGKELGLIKDGRWCFGVRQAESCPIDIELEKSLERNKEEFSKNKKYV